MVGQMNERITVNNLTSVKDAGGGVSKTSSVAFSLWVKAESRTGQANFIEGQRPADYDYKFTARHYDSKLVNTKQTITYGGKLMKVISVQIKDEGKNKWQVIKAAYHG